MFIKPPRIDPANYKGLTLLDAIRKLRSMAIDATVNNRYPLFIKDNNENKC